MPQEVLTLVGSILHLTPNVVAIPHVFVHISVNLSTVVPDNGDASTCYATPLVTGDF